MSRELLERLGPEIEGEFERAMKADEPVNIGDDFLRLYDYAQQLLAHVERLEEENKTQRETLMSHIDRVEAENNRLEELLSEVKE